MRRDDVTAARGWFEQATKQDPALAAAWANLGAIALTYRDYASAGDAYAKAVALDSNRWDTHLAYAWALEGLKKPKEARAEYDKVLALRLNQEDALYGRALALKTEGDLPGAMEAFKAYAAQPKAGKLKEAQAQIASIDLRLKNPPQAPKAAAARPAGGDVDLSRLPVGTDTGPASTQLPSEAPADTQAPQPAPGSEPAQGAPPAPGSQPGQAPQPAPAPPDTKVQR